MRRLRRLPLACALVMVAWSALAAQAPDVPGLVDRALTLLLTPESSDAKCTDGLVVLLDAIVKAAPAARIDGEWPAKVAAAREYVAAGHIGPSAMLLGDSYRAVEGRAFAMPAEVRSPGDARDVIRKQLSSVRDLLAEGRSREAVRRMLAAALIVVTPVQR